MGIKLLVRGPFACFSRPEMKVERMSYPALTPSAARGILEAILYKPQFRWKIRRIHVLNPIKFIGLRRNEVQGKISTSKVKQWMKRKGIPSPLFADAMGRDQGGEGIGRTQRNTVALKDVAYVIEADAWVRPEIKETPRKYYECFQRRVNRGQCFSQPVLGCREFVGYFESAPEHFETISDTRNLGLMLYDVFDLDKQSDGYAKPFITLFSPEMENGVIEVEDYVSVKKRHIAGGYDA